MPKSGICIVRTTPATVAHINKVNDITKIFTKLHMLDAVELCHQGAAACAMSIQPYLHMYDHPEYTVFKCLVQLLLDMSARQMM